MVKLVKVDPQKPDPSMIVEAANLILRGGLVIYPTDTVYGLGANPLSMEAVSKAFKAKGRELKPMPILISSIHDAERVVEVNNAGRRLMERFWPGALTIVLPKREMVPNLLTGGKPGLGVRMPNSPIALALAKACGGLILGTSANISGHPAPTSASEALRELGERVDLVIDGGVCPLKVPSTVVDVSGDGAIILREGAIKAEEILKALKGLT